MFFSDLGLRAPDYYLGVDTSSLGAVLGGVLIGTERVLREVKPDALLVLGDTNSCIAAVMAKRMRIPVYHMEAGNRCFDENVPEETNRRLVDHVADFNLVYTEHARRTVSYTHLDVYKRQAQALGHRAAHWRDRVRRRLRSRDAGRQPEHDRGPGQGVQPRRVPAPGLGRRCSGSFGQPHQGADGLLVTTGAD